MTAPPIATPGAIGPGIMSSFGTGYSGAEKQGFWRSRTTPLDGTRRGLIWSHPATYSAYAFTLFRYLCAHFARKGYLILAPDMFSANHFGVNQAVTDVGLSYDWLRASPSTAGTGGGGADTSRDMVLVISSMGAINALKWLKTNMDKVVHVYGFVPQVDPEDAVNNNRGGAVANATAAWGSLAAWNAAAPTTSPQRYADVLAPIPMDFWYAPDDPAVVEPTIHAWVTKHGNTQIHNQNLLADDTGAFPSGHVFWEPAIKAAALMMAERYPA